MAVQPPVTNHTCKHRSGARLTSVALPNRTAGHFELLSKDVGVPLVCFRLKKVIGSDGGDPKGCCSIVYCACCACCADALIAFH